MDLQIDQLKKKIVSFIGYKISFYYSICLAM